MILEFTTQAEANACLDQINQLAIPYWQSQGYDFEDGMLVGKNAKTGQNSPDKAKTQTWDTVKESPDNTFYFASLAGTPYADAMADLAQAFTFTEKQFPESWVSESA